MRPFAEWLVVSAFGALVVAAAFAMSVQPLEPLGVLSISFWVLAVIVTLVGLASALVLVDLKRTFGGALSVSFLATVIYALALWSPAAFMDHYSTHLFNYALVQAVPVLLISVVCLAVGAMIGTFINNSVREFDL
jgi:hypothetical protein